MKVHRKHARIMSIQAAKLFLELANSQPNVLKEPAPSCGMTGFGDSTQNFELRVYVGEVGLRGSVQNDLQFRVAEACREHDIELAFPQRDVWVRNAHELRGIVEAAHTDDNHPSVDKTPGDK